MVSLYSQEEIYKMHIRDIERECEARGRTEGEARGRAEGEARGRAEGKEDMVIEMLKDNEDLSKIIKFSHFSLEKINEIKARLTNNLQLTNK